MKTVATCEAPSCFNIVEKRVVTRRRVTSTKEQELITIWYRGEIWSWQRLCTQSDSQRLVVDWWLTLRKHGPKRETLDTQHRSHWSPVLRLRPQWTGYLVTPLKMHQRQRFGNLGSQKAIRDLIGGCVLVTVRGLLLPSVWACHMRVAICFSWYI